MPDDSRPRGYNTRIGAKGFQPVPDAQRRKTRWICCTTDEHKALLEYLKQIRQKEANK